MYYKTYPTKKQDDDDLSWTQASPEPVRALARIIWKRRVEREKNGGKDGIWVSGGDVLEISEQCG